MNIQDRRVKKTQQAIRTALMTLMKTKPFSQISITEVTALADINRKSFYNHYNTLQDVLTEFECEIVDQIIDKLGPNFLVPSAHQLIFNTIRDIFNANISEVYLLFESNEFSNLLYTLSTRLKELLPQTPEYASMPNPLFLSFYIDFVTGGMCYTFNTWYKNSDTLSLEELFSALQQFISVLTIENLNSSNSLPFPN